MPNAPLIYGPNEAATAIQGSTRDLNGFFTSIAGSHGYIMQEHMLSQNSTVGKYAWILAVSGGGITMSGKVTGVHDARHMQSWRYETGSGTTGYANHRLGFQEWQFSDVEVQYGVEFLIEDLSDATNEYHCYLGILNAFNASEPTNGIYFEYDRTVNTNWLASTAGTSTRTNTDTGIAVTAGTWFRLELRMNLANDAVAYYINGVKVATNTTNIPTGVAEPCNGGAVIGKSAGTTSRIMHLHNPGFCFYYGTGAP